MYLNTNESKSKVFKPNHVDKNFQTSQVKHGTKIINENIFLSFQFKWVFALQGSWSQQTNSSVKSLVAVFINLQYASSFLYQ